MSDVEKKEWKSLQKCSIYWLGEGFSSTEKRNRIGTVENYLEMEDRSTVEILSERKGEKYIDIKE